MQVKDLIHNTSWRPHAAGEDFTPVISIILPTFRRAKDGMLRNVISSFCSQTLRNIELIVIDDASTDGSADIIHQAMQEDNRISCLTHRQNIGLPAVSEYEGFLKAKGQFIGFAFDDFVFERDAFEKLLGVARCGLPTHGYIRAQVDGVLAEYGKDVSATDELLYRNTIGNSSVLLPREIIDDIGLFDPHVALVRHCDWDLWRRIHKRYQFQKADVFVGYEHGTARSDSLGATYPAFFEAIPEFMNIDRNESLKPKNFIERDIMSAPERSSNLLQDHIKQVSMFFSKKSWASSLDSKSVKADARPIIGIYSVVSPSTSLCFDGVANIVDASMLYIQPLPDCWPRTMQLARCDAVIFVRDLLQPSFISAVNECRRLSIPHYFLSDDNYSLLTKEYSNLAEYTPDRLRDELKTFDGVLVSSRPLKEFYEDQNIHKNVRLFSAIIDQSLLDKCSNLPTISHKKNEIRLGFMGGMFRSQSLFKDTLPALQDVSGTTRIKLYVRGHERDYPIQQNGVEIIGMGAIPNWSEFICTWRSLGLHAILHPMGHTANIDYKTANAILVAYYLGAIPIVNQERAYAGIGIEQGVLKIANSTIEWKKSVEMVISADSRRDMLKKLGDFCKAHFNEHENAEVLSDISDRLQQNHQLRESKLRLSLMDAFKKYSESISHNTELNSRIYGLETELRTSRLDAENTRSAEMAVRDLWTKSEENEQKARMQISHLENIIEKHSLVKKSNPSVIINLNISGNQVDNLEQVSICSDLRSASGLMASPAHRYDHAERVESELRKELEKVHADCKAVMAERDKFLADVIELRAELEKVHADCRTVIRERDELIKSMQEGR